MLRLINIIYQKIYVGFKYTNLVGNTIEIIDKNKNILVIVLILRLW